MPLPIPQGKQREVVNLSATGHRVVLGTAGSGKTTMAILRSAFLSDPELPQAGRVLLLTFNKTLSSYIKSVGGLSVARVRVENYHKFARGYLSSRDLIGYNHIANGRRRLSLIEQAIANVRRRHNDTVLFDRPLQFFEAELSWLAQHGIRSAEEYREVERVGRAQARLERDLRENMWEVLVEYRQLREHAGFRYDFDDLATAVTAALLEDAGQRLYRHIVIDEGQDLSPEMLRSLSLAIPTDGSITFFGDVAQQIYGHRMSWRSAGLNPGPVWEFSHNYRNSREIAALGLAIAAMPYYAGMPDMVTPDPPSAAGPKPTLVHMMQPKDEVAFVVDQAQRFARTQSVAVLTRTVAQQEELLAAFPRGTTNLRDENIRWSSAPSVAVGTYHSAKGLEFDVVILPFLSEELFPEPDSVRDFGSDEARARDGRLLYVGVTRAKSSLILTHSGIATSMLPNKPALYTEVSR